MKTNDFHQMLRSMAEAWKNRGYKKFVKYCDETDLCLKEFWKN